MLGDFFVDENQMLGMLIMSFVNGVGVKTGSGTHPTSHPVSTGESFSWLKQQGREADHSLSSSSEIKNCGAVPLFPIHLHGVVLN
jgi:hypothetical protein